MTRGRTSLLGMGHVRTSRIPTTRRDPTTPTRTTRGRDYTGPYVFRPHFSVGFGIYAGYPVPYAYAYPYSVPVYGYGAPSSTVIVGSNSTRYGGVALEITPGEASVYVDGGYAGLVRDFDGTQRTLTLATGRHRIEISAPGFEPMTLDVDTVPGQIVPYRGDLQPLR